MFIYVKNKMGIKRNDLVIYKLVSIFLRRKLHQQQHQLRQLPPQPPPLLLDRQQIHTSHITIQEMNMMLIRKQNVDLRNIIALKFQRYFLNSLFKHYNRIIRFYVNVGEGIDYIWCHLLSQVMKDWSDLEEKYQGMREKDPSAAEDFKKKMTDYFPKKFR